MKNTKKKIIASVLLLAVLAAFCLAGCAQGDQKGGDETVPSPAETAQESPAAPASSPDAAAGEEVPGPAPLAENIPEEPLQASAEDPAQPPETAAPSDALEPEAPASSEESAPEAPSAGPESVQPVEPQDAVVTEEAHTCTISIECSTILDNMDKLDPDKAELVPDGGVILAPTVVTFYEGESVFNVLQRTCKQNRIHMEFSNTPMYNSAYIEGIHNLYELDCGELSGWMYSVNGWYPNFGCSRYALQDSDVICWRYTCD
nr:DUF4430 domain-containing protein [Clostridia bacterium]